MTVVRTCTLSDTQACLGLFDGNVPKFFAPSERADFAAFLEHNEAGATFLVIERDRRIVACGGHTVEADGETAGLCWGMVDRDLHGTGIGRQLTEARLHTIRAVPGIRRVRLDTSQHTAGFYARFGFVTEKVTKDGYGPGLDRVDMVLDLG